MVIMDLRWALNSMTDVFIKRGENTETQKREWYEIGGRD